MASGEQGRGPASHHLKEVGLEEIESAMQLMDGGDVGKIIIRPNAAVDVTPAPVQEAPPDPNVQGQLFHP